MNNETLDNEVSNPALKPRKWYIASMYSLVFPGLGQVYNGQAHKGFMLFGLLILFPLLFGITLSITSFYEIVLLLIIELLIRIYVIVDSIVHARKQEKYVLKFYNAWYCYLLFALAVLAMFIVFNIGSILGIQSFKIPTTSNNPTIQLGDWVVGDSKAYRKVDPEYGDIVIFLQPDEQYYAFRIVGKPNDEIGLKNNIVSVNRKLCGSTFIKETVNEGVLVEEIEETLPNGHKHMLYRNKQSYDSTKSNLQGITVPNDCYFVLGDNRDNAADSRYLGFINLHQIKGRIIYSYWGQTKERINFDYRMR